jgi:hypothetical protein
MTFYSVSKPYELFFDSNGEPLENGYIYIGEVNQNPITNPLTVYWDKDGLYQAAQPIRTLAGYPSRNGSPGRLFVDSGDSDSYSILVQNKNGELVYNSIDAVADGFLVRSNVDAIADLRAVTYFETPLYLRGHTTTGDGGEGIFEWIDGAAPGTYVDNNGTIIVPTGGDGSGAWLRQNINVIKPEQFGGTDSTAMQAAVNEGTNIELGAKTYTFNNILLPASGINIFGHSPYTTIIENSHATNPTFYTDSSESANLWVFLNNFRIIMATNGQSGDSIQLNNVENILIENCYITTPSGFFTTGNGIYAERTAAVNRGYYITIRKCFIEKQNIGLNLIGGTLYRMNVHVIDDSVINNNTNQGILITETTSIRITRCSLELNTDNIEVINSGGANISENYFERPDDHNIILDTTTACKINHNSIGSGGNVDTVNGRGILVKSGAQFNQIYDNSFIDTWSTYDIEIQAGALQTVIKDNVTKDRVNDWANSGTQVLDNGTQTFFDTPYLTGGGNAYWKRSGQNIMIENFTTPTGIPAKIGETNSGIYAGLNSPENVVTAYRGSLFLRTNGGGGFTFYVKETGDGTNTGWVAK